MPSSAALPAAGKNRPVCAVYRRLQQQVKAAFLHVRAQAAFYHTAYLLGSDPGSDPAADLTAHAVADHSIAASPVEYLPGKTVLIGFPYHSPVGHPVNMQHLSFPLSGSFVL